MATARRLALWGAGGHGKVVADLARAIGYAVVGAIDAHPDKLGAVCEPGGTVVLWNEAAVVSELERLRSLPAGVDGIVLGMGDNVARDRAATMVPGGLLPSLIHPSATVSPSATLGAGTVVFAHAVLNAAAQLGRGVIVNTGAIVEHDCRIGAAAHISPGAILAGGVVVGARAWVGAGAVVLPGLTLDEDAIVGAGAVVTKNVGRGITVAGTPARPLTGQRT